MESKLNRDILFCVCLIILLAAALIAFSSSVPVKTLATSPAATPELPDSADLTHSRELCDRFIKLSFSSEVLHSYNGPIVTVGPRWNALPFDEKNKIASTLGNCLYIGTDQSLKILGFKDYYSGKLIGHLDTEGLYAAD